jgi:hypothetical protein
MSNKMESSKARLLTMVVIDCDSLVGNIRDAQRFLLTPYLFTGLNFPMNGARGPSSCLSNFLIKFIFHLACSIKNRAVGVVPGLLHSPNVVLLLLVSAATSSCTHVTKSVIATEEERFIRFHKRFVVIYVVYFLHTNDWTFRRHGWLLPYLHLPGDKRFNIYYLHSILPF